MITWNRLYGLRFRVQQSNMNMLKFSLVVILSFHLTTCVLADATDDAQNALNTLQDLIQTSSALVSTTAPELWNAYRNEVSEALDEYLANDVRKFRDVINGIARIANNASVGQDCLDLLLSSSGYVENIFSSEELVFSNLLDVATVEISNSASLYADLNSQFVTNCISNKINCPGTSAAILVQAERELSVVQRIPFQLLTEIHLLGYKLEIHMESAHTSLMEIYNRAVQNVTVCVSAKIKEATQDSCNICVMVHPEEQTELETAYRDLSTILEVAALYFPELLYATLLDVNAKGSQDYNSTTDAIDTLDSRIANVISSLLRTAEEFNVTNNCQFYALPSVINISSGRAYSEYDMLKSDLQKRYNVTIARMVEIIVQAESIALEFDACSEAGTSCDYLLEKIISTEFQILWQIEQLVSSTSVTFAQTVTAIRESGARVVRDAVERLEAGMISFKNCIEYA